MNIFLSPIGARRQAASDKHPLQSRRVGAKNTLAIERRDQYPETTGDDRAFGGADNQGADDSECEDSCGDWIRYEYRAEYKADKSPR